MTAEAAVAVAAVVYGLVLLITLGLAVVALLGAVEAVPVRSTPVVIDMDGRLVGGQVWCQGAARPVIPDTEPIAVGYHPVLAARPAQVRSHRAPRGWAA